MNRKSNSLNVILSILVGLTLIFSAVNPTAAYASGAEDVEPTQTPISTPTTPPVDIPSATPVPSETPTPILEPPAPSATVAPTETTALGIVLSFKVDPETVKPGEQFVLYWQVEGLEAIKEEAFLRFYAPPGFVLSEDVAAKTDEENGYVDLPVTETSGKLIWSVDLSASLPAMITSEFWQGKEALAKAEVVIQLREEFLVTASGGEVVGLNDQVRVVFPADALSESVTVKVGQSSAESLPVESLSGSPFEITAVSETTKAEVSKFSKLIEIQVHYDVEAMQGDEENIRLFWYDPADGQWKFPLDQQIDTQNNLIIAHTDHFTVFDTYNSGWQSAETPTMDFFQHAGYTGASSFSMPLKVPAGPGGFQPSLSLSYSSQVVDSSTTDTQASWVGMGWSFDAGGYIERNGFGTYQTTDDSFSLNANGMSGALWPDGNGQYHMENENFANITFDSGSNSWAILGKDGTKYYFEEVAGYTKTTDCPDEPPVVAIFVWRWMLSRVENIYGQTMTYSYVRESTTGYYTNDPGCTVHYDLVHAIYPENITYANERYRVHFNRIPRYDYQSAWLNLYLTGVYKIYQLSLLDNISVEQDADGNGTFETLIRKYKFNYCTSQACGIFPAHIWPTAQQWRTPALASVQEYGLGGSQGLPPYTFTYGDDMHLTNATNGYGGSVEFTYDTWYEDMPFENWADGELETTMPRWGNPLKCTFEESVCGWKAVKIGNTAQGIVKFYADPQDDGPDGNIMVQGLVEMPVQSYQPGRWYRIVASVKAANSGTHTLQLGYSHTLDGVVQPDVFFDVETLTTSPQVIESEPFLLPQNTSAFVARLKSVGYTRVYWYQLVPVPTYARVTTKTVSAGSSYAFSYDYFGEATNSPKNVLYPNGKSVAAGTNLPYTPAYTEFRGHATVTVTDPYGNVTETTYGQNDQLMGRPLSVTVKQGASTVLQTSAIEYTAENTEWAPAVVPLDQEWPHENEPFTGILYRWVRTVSEMKAVPGAVSGSLTTAYTYNLTSGDPFFGLLTQQTISGSVPSLTTHIEYENRINLHENLFIVGLPVHTWVTGSNGKAAESFNLFDQDGILTTTRALMKVVDQQEYFSQMDVAYDIWGNVTSQTAYSDYWTGSGDGSGAPTGARTMTTVYDSAYYTYPISMTTPPVDGFPSGLATTLTYDTTLGVPTSETGPNGSATKIDAEYDSFGRLTKLARPGGGDSLASPTLQISYNDVNAVSPVTLVVLLTQKINSGQSYTATRVYDGLGRQTQVTAGGVSTNFEYGFDASGARLDKVSVPNSTTFWAETVYDALGRPVKVTAPDGTFSTFSYNGLETKVWDAKGNLTITITDILGQTLSVDAPTGPDIAFTYDDLGNLRTAERGGAIVSMNYDLGGRKTGMDDPDMGKIGTPDDEYWGWMYQYDALGNLTSQTDMRGCITSLQYDNLNRLTNKSYSNCPGDVENSPSVQYYYDGQQFTFDNTTYSSSSYAIGQRTGMVAGSTASAWTYDERGRLISETKDFADSSSFTTEWTLYNSADLPVIMKYPDGEFVTTNYDNRMLPISVAGNANYVSSMGYDSAGRMTSRALGNGLTQKYLYKPWNEQGGRLDMMVAGTGAWDETNLNFATTLQKSDYTYDSVGNITTIADSMWGETQTFGYDSLNRLTSASATGGLANYDERYTFDDTTGNLLTKGTTTNVNNQLVGALKLSYDSNHDHAVAALVESQNENNVINTYEYDDNGNQTMRIIGGQTVHLGYDAENRLVSVTGTNLSALFTYNGDGQRVKSVIDNETTLFIGGHYEVLNPGTGQTVTKYYFAGASRIAMRKTIVPQTITLTYLLGDHLGSTSLAVDASTGEVVEMRYKPWGEVRFTTEDLTLPTRYTFTGQYSYISDSATDLTASASFGLMFYNARWYDVQLGRFAQADTFIPDPSNTQAYDRYAYVYNSPLRYTDSSGHCIDGITTWACIIAIGAVVLKIIDYGWTAYDIYDSNKILNDPNTGLTDKMFAGLNIAVSIAFEAAEPDDLLPVGLPLDDGARKLVMKGAREAFEEGGMRALVKHLKENLGEHADDAFKKLDELLGLDKVKFLEKPGQTKHIFREAEGHLVEDTLENRNLLLDTISSEFFVKTDEFGSDIFCRFLPDGTQVWVEVFNGTIRDGGLNLTPNLSCG